LYITVKSRIVKKEEFGVNLACMSEKVNAYRVLMGKFEAKKRYQDLVLDGTAR